MDFVSAAVHTEVSISGIDQVVPITLSVIRIIKDLTNPTKVFSLGSPLRNSIVKVGQENSTMFISNSVDNALSVEDLPVPGGPTIIKGATCLLTSCPFILFLISVSSASVIKTLLNLIKMYKKKYVKVTITMDPTVLAEMKEYLRQVNENKDIMHVSQSDFVTEAVKQLLNKGR